MSFDMIESLDGLNSEIEENMIPELDYLISLKERLETQQLNNIQNIQNERRGFIVEKVDQENLSGRNEEVRRKFSVLDVIVKNGAEKITEDMRSLTKILNVKTSIEQCKESENDHFLEFKIEFPDVKNSCVTFLYDPSTEDFECKSRFINIIIYFLLLFFSDLITSTSQ